MSMSRQEIMEEEAAARKERRKLASYGKPGEVPDDYPVHGPDAAECAGEAK